MSSACEQELVTIIWSGIDQHGALGQAHREQPSQWRIAHRLVVLATPFGVVARGQPQGALDPEIEHPGIRQPAGAGADEIRRPHHGVAVDPRRVDRGFRRRRGGVRSRLSGPSRRRRSPNPGAPPPGLRPPGGRRPRRPSTSTRRACWQARVPRGAALRARACARRRVHGYAPRHARRGRLADRPRETCSEVRTELSRPLTGTVWRNCTELSLARQGPWADSVREGSSPCRSKVIASPSLVERVRRAAAWPFRVAATRATLNALAAMDGRELADIGLTRSDLRDVSALALDHDPTALLARRARERRRSAFAPPTAPTSGRMAARPGPESVRLRTLKLSGAPYRQPAFAGGKASKGN